MVYLYSTIKMMHGPINIRSKLNLNKNFNEVPNPTNNNFVTEHGDFHRMSLSIKVQPLGYTIVGTLYILLRVN